MTVKQVVGLIIAGIGVACMTVGIISSIDRSRKSAKIKSAHDCVQELIDNWDDTMGTLTDDEKHRLRELGYKI